MNYFDWQEKYRPIEDPEEGEVRYHGDPIVQNADPKHVWSLIDGDDGQSYIVNGIHLVNRVGFIVTEEPFEGEFLEIIDD